MSGEVQEQEQEPTVSPMHTSCKSCVFRENDENGTQVGCGTGRTATYAEQGVLLECVDAENDEFYVVNDRMCNAYRDRNGPWAEKYAGRHKERAEEEVRLRGAFVIVVGEHDTKKDLEKTLNATFRQSLPPYETYIVNAGSSIDKADLHELCWEGLSNRVTWRMIELAGEDKSFQAAVDEAVVRTKCSVYVPMRPGARPPYALLLKVDRFVNKRLERFGVIRLEGSPVVHVGTHRHPEVGGNRPVPIDCEEKACSRFPAGSTLQDAADKIEYLAILQGATWMVRDWSEVE